MNKTSTAVILSIVVIALLVIVIAKLGKKSDGTKTEKSNDSSENKTESPTAETASFVGRRR